MQVRRVCYGLGDECTWVSAGVHGRTAFFGVTHDGHPHPPPVIGDDVRMLVHAGATLRFATLGALASTPSASVWV